LDFDKFLGVSAPQVFQLELLGPILVCGKLDMQVSEMLRHHVHRFG
jgi:hypothetical protein